MPLTPFGQQHPPTTAALPDFLFLSHVEGQMIITLLSFLISFTCFRVFRPCTITHYLSLITTLYGTAPEPHGTLPFLSTQDPNKELLRIYAIPDDAFEARYADDANQANDERIGASMTSLGAVKL